LLGSVESNVGGNGIGFVDSVSFVSLLAMLSAYPDCERVIFRFSLSLLTSIPMYFLTPPSEVSFVFHGDFGLDIIDECLIVRKKQYVIDKYTDVSLCVDFIIVVIVNAFVMDASTKTST
jgi:hypothetical protein